MVDLTGIEGLSEEQSAKLKALFDTEIGGLKNKVDELIGEKRNVQASSTEKDQIIEDARKAAAKAHEETLIASGKTDELKAFYEEQLATTTAELTATAKTAKDALTSRDRGDVMGKVMGLVHDDHRWNSEAMLSNMLEIGYNDQQQLTTQFKHNGEVVANNVDEFKSWAGEQDSFKKILKGVDSSGADTTQSRGGSATTGQKYSDLSLEERAKFNNQ
ncbi:MAG: hypothetical protein MJK15_05135 [Colwellia sp.]|nr:hypothetical protein [Colwellia sp.]